MGETGSGCDSIVIMQECIDFANGHDFEMIKEDGEWVINTEVERDIAIQCAKELSSNW